MPKIRAAVANRLAFKRSHLPSGGAGADASAAITNEVIMRYLIAAVLAVATILQGCLPQNPMRSNTVYNGIQRHIDVDMDQEGPLVKVFYVEPPNTIVSDAEYRQHELQINELVNNTQQLFADEMTRHGYGSKTFVPLRKPNGELKIRRITYNLKLSNIRWDDPNTYLYFIDKDDDQSACNCGVAIPQIANVNQTWNTSLIAHELGHAFDLKHDRRERYHIMSAGIPSPKLSAAHAGWLNQHPAFNSNVVDSRFEVDVGNFRMVKVDHQVRVSFVSTIWSFDGYTPDKSDTQFTYGVFVNNSSYWNDTVITEIPPESFIVGTLESEHQVTYQLQFDVEMPEDPHDLEILLITDNGYVNWSRHQQ